MTRLGGDPLGEAIRRMRAGEVRVDPGYDGEYGRITLFAPGEAKDLEPQELLFRESAAPRRRQPRSQRPTQPGAASGRDAGPKRGPLQGAARGLERTEVIARGV